MNLKENKNLLIGGSVLLVSIAGLLGLKFFKKKDCCKVNLENKFKDKVIWITGASSGIGESLVYELEKHGAKLIISSRQEKVLNEVKAKCTNKENINVLPLDLEKLETLEEKTKQAISIYGKVDILVNNGGIGQRALAKDTPLAIDQKIMNINYFGSIALTKNILHYMRERKEGHIVTVSSLVGKFGTQYRSAYSASKHALHGFFDSLRSEVYKDNIKVTLICPGFIKTNITASAFAVDEKDRGKKNNIGMSSDIFAKKMAYAIAKEQEEALIGRFENVGVYAKRYFPLTFSKLIRKTKVT